MTSKKQSIRRRIKNELSKHTHATRFDLFVWIEKTMRSACVMRKTMVFALLYLAIFLNQFLKMQMPFLSNDSIGCHWKISVEKNNSSFNKLYWVPFSVENTNWKSLSFCKIGFAADGIEPKFEFNHDFNSIWYSPV